MSAKLAPNWEGPYEIIGVKPPNVNILDMDTGRRNPKVHVTEIKKYREGQVTRKEGELTTEESSVT